MVAILQPVGDDQMLLWTAVSLLHDIVVTDGNAEWTVGLWPQWEEVMQGRIYLYVHSQHAVFIHSFSPSVVCLEF